MSADGGNFDSNRTGDIFTGSSFSDGIASLSWLHRGFVATDKEATILSGTLIFFFKHRNGVKILLQLLLAQVTCEGELT